MQEAAVAESEEVAETYEFEAEVAKVIRPPGRAILDRDPPDRENR